MYMDLHPSLASLGDGLPDSVGTQRDEAKRQASILPRTETQYLSLENQCLTPEKT